MKKTLFTCLLGILLLACNQQEDFDYYGDKISINDAISAKKLSEKLDDKDSLNVKIKATIIETCEKKGCWMTLDLGNDQEMRVTFKDYGFFVPKDSVEGREVIIDGVALKSTTDVETLRHFAEDAGKSPQEIADITEPKSELTFVATGVAIARSQE